MSKIRFWQLWRWLWVGWAVLFTAFDIATWSGLWEVIPITILWVCAFATWHFSGKTIALAKARELRQARERDW